MQQIGIPCIAVRDILRRGAFLDLFEEYSTRYVEDTGAALPMMMAEPQSGDLYQGPFVISEAPEELVVATFEERTLRACYEALERVEAREPKIKGYTQTKLPKLKDNVSLKKLFRAMADAPVTVFSFAFDDPSSQGAAMFFLRTPFTISEFKRELQKPI